MILSLIEQLGAWSWWILGLLLLGVEIMAPGFVFIWFGLAALVVGGVALLTTIGWQTQLILFAVLSLVMVLIGRRVFRSTVADDGTRLNERAKRMIGQTFVLMEPIQDGFGRVRVDDTPWRVSGPNLAEGTRVIVQQVDGAVLMVQAADPAEAES